MPALVSTVQGTTTGGTSHVLTLPTRRAGQRIIVLLAWVAPSVTVTFPDASWHALGITNYGVTDGYVGAWYHDVDGSEGATITCTTTNAARLTHILRRFSNVIDTTINTYQTNGQSGAGS